MAGTHGRNLAGHPTTAPVSMTNGIAYLVGEARTSGPGRTRSSIIRDEKSQNRRRLARAPLHPAQGTRSGRHLAAVEGDALDADDQFFDGKGLGQVIAGAILEGGDGFLNGAVTGDQDHIGFRRLTTHGAKQVQARSVRKVNVCDHDVEGIARHRVNGLGNVANRGHAVAVCFKGRLQAEADCGIIVNDKQLAARYPEAAPQAAPPLERERQLYGWRREVAQLESTVTGSAYYVHAPDVSSPSDSANPVGDQFPASGAGAELAYRPPKIGFRDGRTLQLFGRVFWTAEDGPAPEGDTVQAGLGVRYKPFASQNLVLSGERLVAIGSDARNDWLLRAGYSFGSSADLEPGRDRANYTSLYADAAVIPTSELPLFLTGELIQGISFNALPQTAVIPHLLAAGNLVDDEGGNSSGLYVGLGLRLKAWPLETKYQAGRVALTMDVQYRQQVVGNRDDSGVVVRLVAGF